MHEIMLWFPYSYLFFLRQRQPKGGGNLLVAEIDALLDLALEVADHLVEAVLQCHQHYFS